MSDTGGLIVATPAADDPVNQLSQEDQAHITMVWFGDAAVLPPDVVDGVRQALGDVSTQCGSFDAMVSGVAILGADKASVLLIESQELVDLRNELCLSEAVRIAWGMADHQFPWWQPHLTISYDGQIVSNPPETIRFDALDLWLGAEKESYPLTDTVMDDLMAAGCAIPPVWCPDDLPMALNYADQHPAARWYVQKRAAAFDLADRVPAGWSA